MKILHLLSQTHLTGPEVYAAGLIRCQVEQGHECLIVSDTLSVATEGRYIPMRIHDRSLVNRVRNIRRLARLCREEEVDLIHAHSRAASWIANIVSRMVPVTYVSTMHGRQSRRAARSRHNVYGRHIIAVCEHIAEHIRTELRLRDAQIHLVRNGID